MNNLLYYFIIFYIIRGTFVSIERRQKNMISKLSFSSLGKYLAPIIVGLIVFAIGTPEGLSSGAWIFVSIFAP